MLFLWIRCSKFSFSEFFSLWGWLQPIAFSRSVDYAHVLITCSSHCLVVVCFFSRLAVLITVSGLKEHQRSHCTYIFLRDRPLFIFWKGQRGVGGRGAIKIYPILHTSLGCSCDRPSWRRLIPPSFPLKTMYLSLPPPKKKEEEEKEKLHPSQPPRARC